MARNGGRGFFGKMAQRSNYAYANARVRVRKSRLLPRDSYPKLLKLDIPEITRVIEGAEYGPEIDELASAFAGVDLLENSLNVNEERNYAEVRSFVKGEVAVLVGRYLERYTIWNLKTILRGRFWGARPEEIQRELLIENRAEHDFYRTLIEAEGAGVRPVVEALAQNPKTHAYHRVLKAVEQKVPDDALLLQHFEDALDRAYYVGLVDSLRPYDPDKELFLQYVRKEIDVVNLGIVLRLEWRNDPTTRALEFMIPGGLEFKDADLRRLAEANTRQELVERLKEYPVYDQIKDALQQSLDTGSLLPVQIALTKSLADYAQRFAYRNPLSVLPVVNYLMRKHLEVKNLRAIARGKAAGLSEAQIEGLLVVI